MRRSAPRPLGHALRKLAGEGAPQTLLARVQAAWPEAAGPVYGEDAEPVSERGGRVSIACSSAAVAEQLTFAEPDLRERLNGVLEASREGPVTRLRFAYGRSRGGRPGRGP